MIKLKEIFNVIKSRIYILILKHLMKYLNYLQNRMILKKRLILNLKKSFSNQLNQIDYKTITPEYKIEFDRIIDKKFLYEPIICLKSLKNFQEKPFVQKETFICCLKNVKFFSMSGGISYKSKVLIESLMNLERVKRTKCVDSFFLKHKKKYGAYTSIMFLPWGKNNLFHWLIECLPRLYGILKVDEPKINLIVHKDITKLQLETLNFFIDKRFQIVKINPYEVWNIEKYYLPSFCNDNCSAYIPKEYIEFIRKKILDGYKIKPKNKRSRIYISRSKASSRRLKNEEEFCEFIRKKYNFKKIHSEDLPFKDQVEIFNSAEIIITIHGAGLVNILFSENLTVIELFPPNEIKTHYFMLSKALNFDYKYIIGKEQDRNLDFKIEVSDVARILKEVTIEKK